MDWKKLGKTILAKMKETRILAIIGLVLLYAGLMMPMFGIESGSSATTASFVDAYDNGKGASLLVVLSAILIFSDIIAANWKKGEKVFSKLTNRKLLLIPVIIFAIILIVTQVKFFNDIDDSFFYDSDDVYLYPGYFINWLGMIALVAYVFLYKGKEVDKVDEETKE